MTRNNFKKEDFAKEINNRVGLSLNLSKKIIDDLIIIFSQNIKIILNLKILGVLKY